MSTSPSLTSELEVVNVALKLLGQRSLGSLDDTTEAAKLAKSTFAQLRESEMSSFSWRFCTKFAAIPRATLPAGTFGWKSAFTLPVDMLAVWNVEDESDMDGYEWALEGDLLLTNIIDAAADGGADEINIRYCYENLSVPAWDASFLDTLISRCVMEWAEALRASSTHTERAVDTYREKRGKNRHTDSIQGSARNFITSRWTGAR